MRRTSLALAALLMIGLLAAPVASAAPPPEVNKDIYVPEFMACTWKGSYKETASAGGVRVFVYTCDPPGP